MIYRFISEIVKKAMKIDEPSKPHTTLANGSLKSMTVEWAGYVDTDNIC